jgi:hypothetical protein
LLKKQSHTGYHASSWIEGLRGETMISALNIIHNL